MSEARNIYDVDWVASPDGGVYYVCPICERKFSTLKDYYRHLDAGHKEEVNVERDTKVRDFLKEKYGEKADEIYSAITGLVASGNYGKKPVCPFCGKELLSTNELEYHLAKRHGDEILDSLELNFGKGERLGHSGWVEDLYEEIAEKSKVKDRRGVEFYRCVFWHSKPFFTQDDMIKHYKTMHKIGEIKKFLGKDTQATKEDLIHQLVQAPKLKRDKQYLTEGMPVYYHRCPYDGYRANTTPEFVEHLNGHTVEQLQTAVERLY